MKLNNYDFDKIEFSLCSRLKSASPLPLPNFYYLVDLILYTNTLEVHVEIHADAFVMELYAFLKDQPVTLADPFKLMTLSCNPGRFNAVFNNFCKNHFDELAACYHLDHPRRITHYSNK